MQARLTIPGKMPSLNDYIAAMNRNRYAGNAMKHEQTDRVCGLALAEQMPHFEGPVRIRFTWYERNRRGDIDNVSFAQKFILDGLVKAGVIKDDSQRYVTGLEHEFRHDKDDPRIEIGVFE